MVNALGMRLQPFELGQGADISNALAPIQRGIDTYREGMDKAFQGERALNRERLAQRADDRASQSHDMEMQKAKVGQIAGIAAAALNEKDPARQAKMMQQAYALHPGIADHLTKAGVNPSDHVGTAKFLLAEARGFGVYNPLDDEAKRAGIAQTRASTAATNASMMQLQKQSPEYRAKIAGEYGLQRGTPEFNAFVLNGTYTPTPKDDLLTTSEGQTISRKVRGPDGHVIGAEPLVQGTPKAPPEHISKTANFTGRMIEAERHIRRLTEGKDPISGEEGQKFGATDVSTGLVNLPPDGIANLMRSPDHQQYRQAAKQWIRAFLRKESGAAISDGEFAQDFQTYFPQPGDSKEVVEQKRNARTAAMSGFALEAGDYFTKQRPDLALHLKQYSSTSPDATIKTEPGKPTAPPSMPRITSDEEWSRLPPGTTYIAPDGKPKVKR